MFEGRESGKAEKKYTQAIERIDDDTLSDKGLEIKGLLLERLSEEKIKRILVELDDLGHSRLFLTEIDDSTPEVLLSDLKVTIRELEGIQDMTDESLYGEDNQRENSDELKVQLTEKAAAVAQKIDSILTGQNTEEVA